VRQISVSCISSSAGAPAAVNVSTANNSSASRTSYSSSSVSAQPLARERFADWVEKYLFVEDVPGDHHRHDDGLVRAGRHLAALPREGTAVAGNLDAHPLGGRSFGQPDERFHRLQLAEEKAPLLELPRVAPVLQQPLGNAGDARMPALRRPSTR